MRLCKLLDDTSPNIAPTTAKEARALIGKRVEYLRECDIDKTGRGYVFPKRGTIIGQYSRNLEIDHAHNYVWYPDIREMRELT